MFSVFVYAQDIIIYKNQKKAKGNGHFRIIDDRNSILVYSNTPV